jgi:transposase
LAQACSQLLRVASVQAVAQFYALGWHTVSTDNKN